jgi:hypothetical protein
VRVGMAGSNFLGAMHVCGCGRERRYYQTLPANISRHLSSENLPPGRDFLKRYLETSGYLPATSAGTCISKTAYFSDGVAPANPPQPLALSVPRSGHG